MCRCSTKRIQKVKRYTLVATEAMWEMAIWVFVRTPHANDISTVSTAFEATGLSIAKELTGKQLGNKGAVGVSFVWGETPLCFVNCHLAAQARRIMEREDNYCQIVSRLALHTLFPDTGVDFLHQHDHVFWFGDMNYRVRVSLTAVVAHTAVLSKA